MTPRLLSHAHEQGYYIIWDTVNWQKTRVSSSQMWFSYPQKVN